MTIAVLIPCYNEAKTIAKVVRDYRAALPEADIYVYDNNSTDHTDDIAREAGAIVRYEYRQGKGNVIRSMFREIDADCYLMIDGDDTYPAENAREMVNLVLERKVDMVVGDRLSATYYTENKRPFHNLGNRLVKGLVNTIFKGSVSDIMTGYRAFSRRFVKNFPALSGGFQLETEMTIFALSHHMRIRRGADRFYRAPRRELLEAQHVPRRSRKCCCAFSTCTVIIGRWPFSRGRRCCWRCSRSRSACR